MKALHRSGLALAMWLCTAYSAGFGQTEIAEPLRATTATDGGDAVSLYQELLELYPDDEGNDRVLYQLALAHHAIGEPDEALDALTRLVEEFPASELWSQTYFRRGEILFAEERYDEAEASYRIVLSRGDATFREQSLYKSGWSLFLQGRYGDALEPFLNLLDERLPSAAETARFTATPALPAHEIVGDSLRALRLAYSNLDGPETLAASLIDRPDAAYARLLYSRLGESYLARDRYSDAAETFQAYVNRAPLDSGAPALMRRVIDAYARGTFASLVLASKEEFVRRFGPEAEFWDAHDPEEMPDVRTEAARHLLDLARDQHAVAQADGNPQAYQRAANQYRSYIQAFPEQPDVVGANLLLAEVLFELGEFDAAAEEYERTAYDYAAHDAAADAAYGAVVAYRAHLSTGLGADIGRWRQVTIDNALRFASTFPDHDEAGTVLLAIAQDLLESDEPARAAGIAHRVAGALPSSTSDEQRIGWTIAGHAYFDLGRFVDAEYAYSHAHELASGDVSVSRTLVERTALSIYSQGEQRRDAGDLIAAARHFSRVRAEHPLSSIVATADYDAAAMLVQLEDWPAAAVALEDFRNRYPSHELQLPVTQTLVVTYIELTQPGKAAEQLDRIAVYPGQTDETRKVALWRAAELYERAGQNERARIALETLLAGYAEGAPAGIEVRQRLADLALTEDNRSQYEFWLEDVIVADGLAGTARTDRTRTLAANAALELAHRSFMRFKDMSLTAPLPDSLQAKRKQMELALSAYQRAAEYQIADVTTAATYYIAELYAQLSSDLLESERPTELTPVELAQYDILLEEQAFPFEEQAIELYELNAAKTADGVFDEWVRNSLQALAALMPVRYGKTEKGESVVGTIH